MKVRGFPPKQAVEPAFVDVFFCFRGGMLGGVGDHRGADQGSKGEFPNGHDRDKCLGGSVLGLSIGDSPALLSGIVL